MNGGSGVVTSEVTPEWTGSTLVTATTSSTTVLVVKEADDFDEKFAAARWLVIGEETTPRQYIAVQNDEDEGPQTVTLAAPVGSVLEAGLPVVVYDTDSTAADKRGVEYWTTVLLDGQPEGTAPIPIAVDHLSIPVADFSAMVGARVLLSEDEDEPGKWWVSRILGRAPVVNPENLDQTKLSDLIGEYAPDGGSGQTFSPDEPSTTEGFQDGHAWWQIVDGNVVGFWRLDMGMWVRQEIVTAEALVATNAIIDALSGTSLDYVTIAGGSINIAQGVAETDPEGFSGTSLPSGWSSVRTGSGVVPGTSVVSTGPTGQVGSALLIDFGPSGSADANASGEVDTDLGDVANAQISVRFRVSVLGEIFQPEQAYLAIRSNDGDAFSSTWDAITLALISQPGLGGMGNFFFSVQGWQNGASSELGQVEATTSGVGSWHRAKFRVQAGQVAAKVWQDGSPEPGFSSFPQSSIAAPGRTSLVWRQNTFFSSSRGQQVYLDSFDVESYAAGFSVGEDGSMSAPLHTQRGRVSTGTFTGPNVINVVPVTFPQPFAAAPEVTVSLYNATRPDNIYPPSPANVTADGFDLYAARSSGSAAFDVSWTAGPPA